MRKLLCFFLFMSVVVSACGPVTPMPKPLASPKPIATATVNNHPGFEPITAKNIDRLDEIAYWGDGDIYGVAVSPDQKMVAVYTQMGVSLLDSQSLETIGVLLPKFPGDKFHLPKHYYRAETVSFSPDGKSLAVASDYHVEVWDIATQKNIAFFSLWVPDLRPSGIHYSPNGKFIAVSSSGGNTPCDGAAGNLALYNLKGSLIFSRYSCPPFFHPWLFTTDNRFLDVDYNFGESPQSMTTEKYLAAIDLTNDVPDKISFVPLGNIDYGGITRFSPDGAFFAARRYDAKDTKYQVIETATLKSVDVEGDVEFVPARNGKYTWKLRTTEPQKETLPCNLDQAPQYIILTKNAKNVLINHKNQFELINLSDCKVTKKVLATGIQPIVFSPNGRLFAAWDTNHVDIMSGDERSLISSISVNFAEAPIDVLGFNQDGSLMATGPRGGIDSPDSKRKAYQLTIWDTQKGLKIKTLTPVSAYLQNIMASPNKNIMVVQDSAGFGFWDIQNGSLLRSIPASTLSFHPNGKLMAAGFQGSVEIADFKTGNMLRKIEIPNCSIDQIIFSADGSKLAINAFNTVERDKVVAIFDINTGKLIYHIGGFTWIPTLRSENQSNLFAFDRGGGKIEIWNFEQDHPLHVFHGVDTIQANDKKEYSISIPETILFNRNGELLFSLEEEKILIWDTKTGLLLRQIPNNVYNTYFGPFLTFSPDGYFIFATDTEGIIHVWGVRKP